MCILCCKTGGWFYSLCLVFIVPSCKLHLNIHSFLQEPAAASGVVPPEVKEALPDMAEAPVPTEGEPVQEQPVAGKVCLKVIMSNAMNPKVSQPNSKTKHLKSLRTLGMKIKNRSTISNIRVSKSVGINTSDGE